MFEQAPIAVQDEKKYAALHSQIDAKFASSDVEVFLNRVTRSKLRIRDFETVLGKGSLGAATEAEYRRLDNSAQGQIRELYLASLEHVAPELREKFFKLYAYY